MVGPCTWDTAAYVSRYTMKKRMGPSSVSYYADRGQAPEFVRMSRMPGIGRDYYDNFKDSIYATDEVFVESMSGPRSVKPGRYYDKLYDLEDTVAFSKIKEVRKNWADTNSVLLYNHSGLTR